MWTSTGQIAERALTSELINEVTLNAGSSSTIFLDFLDAVNLSLK